MTMMWVVSLLLSSSSSSLIPCVMAAASNSKQLVILAGPHHTADDSMRKWFDKFATDYDDSKTSSSLAGGKWKWPTLKEEELKILQDENVSRHSMFKLLFHNEQDSSAPHVLLKAIRENWETAEYGIILGDPNFDKIGENPFSHLDSLKTIYRIVEDLSVLREDVTIVLIHRAPRLKQWLNIWNVQSNHDDYEGFVCDEDEADKRWEYADNAMNIGLLSKDFLQNGFNVVVIDEEGTKRSKLDPSHTLACNILQGVECFGNGWVLGLEDELTDVDYQDDDLYEEWSGLTLQQLHDLESLFLQRDCVYQSELERHERFRVLNQHSLFAQCEIQDDMATREKLMDTDFIVSVIQLQKGCNSTVVDPSDVLPSTSNASSRYSTSSSRIAAGECFLAILLVILFVCGAALAYLLWQSHRQKQSEGDGLFKNSPPMGIFRNRIFSDGSTESSSDDETSSPQKAKGMMDGSLEKDQTVSPPAIELCKACMLVRIDPKCPFCRGGQPTPLSPEQGSVRTKPVVCDVRYDSNISSYTDSPVGDKSLLCRPCASSLQGPNPHCPRCQEHLKKVALSTTPYLDNRNDRWHVESGSMSWDKDSSAVVQLEDFKFGSHGAELSLRKLKRDSKSRVFRKLTELSKLKHGKDDGRRLNSNNLQMDRDDESLQMDRDDGSEIDFY